MEENARKHRKINILIPKLLEQSNKYTKIFKDKNKINNIFTDLEIKSSNHFNFFIKESINRYRNMKLGNDLSKLVANTEKRRTTEIKKVLTDNFFSDKNINQEKKNTKNYTSDKIYKNLQKTFKLIKDSGSDTAKDFSKEKDKKKMEKIKSTIDNRDNLLKNVNVKELLKKGKQEMNCIFKKENSKIEKMFDKYREDINILQQVGEQSPEKYASLHKKLEITLPKLEMIKYSHYEPPKLMEKDIEVLQKKTLDRIMPFTKYNKFDKKRNKTNKTQDIKIKKIFEKIILNKKLSFVPATENSSQSNINKEDLNNTNDIVFNTACKELTIKNYFDNKRRKLNELLGYEVPNLSNYKNIIKKKFKDMNRRRNLKNKENLKYQKYETMTYYDKLNMKINNEITLLTEVEKDLLKKPIDTQ